MHLNMTFLELSLFILLVVAAAAALILMRRKTQRLQTKFGSEYARVLEDSGGRLKAEAGLRGREKRVEALSIRPLTPNDRERYVASWTQTQARFVEDPASAVREADALINDVMATRGYPVGDFAQRSADISVDHPGVVEHYRAGHDIAERQQRGEAGTEDLRQAMNHFRALFDDLMSAVDMAPSSPAA